MVVLGIETSCDDSAVGVWCDGGILANVVHTQKIHAKWGGVIPELASRDHILTIIPSIREALNEAEIELDALDAVAVCGGPGLLGSLLVGLCTAKSIAWALDIPFIAVHHLEGHLFAAQIGDYIRPPFLALIVSGGHSHIYSVPEQGKYKLLGRTRDDAAGEAFDKGAKAMGLSYPGGPAVEKAANNGNPTAFDFPRAMQKPGELDMSFSGLKTALLLTLDKIPKENLPAKIPDLSASYQEAIVDALIWKLAEAAKAVSITDIVVVGGVASNKRFREKLTGRAESENWNVRFPPPELCTDNGVMIAAAGAFRLKRGERSGWNTTAVSRWPLGNI
ncbi:tRNA (adenosine(37)-N6)-threonylcarbamoyltransferase complex transferase subunit TsaD [bacterium]|nr:MAG: tRNA (adenosine(37)-N6)-threonylcarbamoyltransferase complex transferase subunit TsaD [bacterium]